MNFLAHIYLSGNNDDLIIGNFIADFIEANHYKHLPIAIQNGIFLHRKIDSFTDTHEIVRKSKRRLQEQYGHYNGIIIDIIYDHFLAKNWANYTTTSLEKTEQYFLNLMHTNFDLLPKKVQHILPYMQEQKWLSGYISLEGIEKALISMNKRTKNKSQMHLAIEDLRLHYKEFESDFISFFKDLITHSNQVIKELANNK